MVYGKYFDTVLGRLYAAAENGCVVRLGCEKAAEEDIVVNGGEEHNYRDGADAAIEDVSVLLDSTIAQVAEYLDGKRFDFDIPIQVTGTPFQRKVWNVLCGIPYGEKRTYGEVAKAAGCPKGARAVGMACSRNPIMLLIPCHRVVGSTGKLVGFAAGLQMKEYLLKLEQSRGTNQ